MARDLTDRQAAAAGRTPAAAPPPMPKRAKRTRARVGLRFAGLCLAAFWGGIWWLSR